MFLKHNLKTPKKYDDISRLLQNEKNSNYYSRIEKICNFAENYVDKT